VSLVEWLNDTVAKVFGSDVLQYPDWREWLEQLYAEHGAVSAPELAAMATTAKERAIHAAGRRVEGDLARTTTETVRVAPLVDGDKVHIICDGLFDSDSPSDVFWIGEARIAAAVAATVQDILMDRWWTVWPLCVAHDAGFHAQLVDDRAMWVCRLGQHETEVGALSADG